MARRPNYGFEKRQKELDRQKKKEAKAERRQMRKEEATRDDESGVVGPDGVAPAADAETPSEPESDLRVGA